MQPSMIELTFTAWPAEGPPAQITRAWNVTLQANAPVWSHDCPVLDTPHDYIRLCLDQVVPADPGWIAATAYLVGTYGQPLSKRIPVRFYGKLAPVGTHLYFPSNGYDPAHSVEIRVISGGVTDGD